MIEHISTMENTAWKIPFTKKQALSLVDSIFIHLDLSQDITREKFRDVFRTALGMFPGELDTLKSRGDFKSSMMCQLNLNEGKMNDILLALCHSDHFGLSIQSCMLKLSNMGFLPQQLQAFSTKLIKECVIHGTKISGMIAINAADSDEYDMEDIAPRESKELLHQENNQKDYVLHNHPSLHRGNGIPMMIWYLLLSQVDEDKNTLGKLKCLIFKYTLYPAIESKSVKHIETFKDLTKHVQKVFEQSPSLSFRMVRAMGASELALYLNFAQRQILDRLHEYITICHGQPHAENWNYCLE